MKIVVENTEEDLERERVKKEVEWVRRDVDTALLSLTANLFRVTRGAGRAWEIAKQTRELLDAFVVFAEAAKHLPPADGLQAALNIEPELRNRGTILEDLRPRQDAEQDVIRGALQIAASRLLGQGLQEARGMSEMYSGINQIIELRREESEQRIREREAERKAKSSKAAAKRQKPKSPKSIAR
jgi:hypothetical protein